MESISKTIDTNNSSGSANSENSNPSEYIQVAGHTNTLIINKDKIYKKAKEHEIEFYHWLYGPACPETMKQMVNYIPKFYGIETIGENKYLILENLNRNCEHANLMDCKLGKITWKQTSSLEKIEKKKLNNANSTTNLVGFRVSGMIIKDSEGNITDAAKNKDSFELIKNKNDIKHYFTKFISVNGEIKRSVLEFIKIQIGSLLTFFREQQTEKRFLASSLYFVIGKNNMQQLKLIDFANTEDSEGELDNNVIEALEEMLSIWDSLSI